MRLFSLLLGLTLWLTPVHAQEQRIQDVIASQIEAFEAQDVETAFSYASPNIQSIFGTSENFGTMVRNGYPMVWAPTAYEFLDQQDHGATTWQRLKFTDAQGKAHWFAYEMVQVNGAWRINGVFRLDPPGLSA